MKVLVTGSSGFVGKRLVKALRKKKFAVRCFDIAEGDSLLDGKKLQRKLRGIDAVVHLAAELDESSGSLFETNVGGTALLLQKCAEAEVKRFIYLSTVGVMGNLQGKANELTGKNPVTRYEKSKAEAGELVEQFQGKLNATILRSALVLGPNRYWMGILGLVGKGFPLIGPGKNRFQLVYVQDLVNAIVFCLENEHTAGELFIVAEEEGATLAEFYSKAVELLGKGGKVKRIPVWLGILLSYLYIIVGFVSGKKALVTPAHIERLLRERNYNVSKLLEFGWKPEFNSFQGLEKTIKQLKKGK